MKRDENGKIIHRGILLIVFVVVLLAAGIASGLLLPNPHRNEDPNATADIASPPTNTATDTGPSATETPEPPPSKSTEPDDDQTPESDPPDSDTSDVPIDDDDEIPEVDPIEEKVAQIVASMTLREKICQMLIVSPDAITGVQGTTIPGSITKKSVERYPVGGFIQSTQNIKDGAQILKFNTTVQTFSKIPLFIGVDEEGGRVGRLKSTLEAHTINAMMTYADDGETVAFENAKTLAGALKKYGFNLDFAPVADVLSNPENTVIGDRAYSTNFDTAALLVASAVNGFHSENIVCTLKHFPGHGSTQEDSHTSVTYVNRTLDELNENEFKPFAAGIIEGADFVMVGHLIVPSIDELPASLSRTLITDILRGELGFNGVVITDSLSMSSITSQFNSQQVAVTAIQAGVDILLMPSDIDATITAIITAIENDEITVSRINESVSRIIRAKVEAGIV